MRVASSTSGSFDVAREGSSQHFCISSTRTTYLTTLKQAKSGKSRDSQHRKPYICGRHRTTSTIPPPLAENGGHCIQVLLLLKYRHKRPKATRFGVLTEKVSFPVWHHERRHVLRKDTLYPSPRNRPFWKCTPKGQDIESSPES